LANRLIIIIIIIIIVIIKRGEALLLPGLGPENIL
jgi:hypothetical protein